jgi:hypothetical protein
VNAASLLVASAPDAATSIARFTDVTLLEDLQSVGFTANDLSSLEASTASGRWRSSPVDCIRFWVGRAARAGPTRLLSRMTPQASCAPGGKATMAEHGEFKVDAVPPRWLYPAVWLSIPLAALAFGMVIASVLDVTAARDRRADLSMIAIAGSGGGPAAIRPPSRAERATSGDTAALVVEEELQLARLRAEAAVEEVRVAVLAEDLRDLAAAGADAVEAPGPASPDDLALSPPPVPRSSMPASARSGDVWDGAEPVPAALLPPAPPLVVPLGSASPPDPVTLPVSQTKSLGAVPAPVVLPRPDPVDWANAPPDTPPTAAVEPPPPVAVEVAPSQPMTQAGAAQAVPGEVPEPSTASLSRAARPGPRPASTNRQLRLTDPARTPTAAPMRQPADPRCGMLLARFQLGERPTDADRLLLQSACAPRP